MERPRVDFRAVLRDPARPDARRAAAPRLAGATFRGADLALARVIRRATLAGAERRATARFFAAGRLTVTRFTVLRDVAAREVF